MGNGSSKHGDAKADLIRDEFAKNRKRRQWARAQLDSIRSWDDDDEVTDTQRIQAVLADSKMPDRAKAAVGFMAAFPRHHRIWAWVVLALLIIAVIALGAVKLLS